MPVLEPNAGHPEKPCRSCTDFKSWAKMMGNAPDAKSSSSSRSAVGDVAIERSRRECPLDKDELGRSTWGLLHTMAATYPQKPSPQEVKDTKSFFDILSRTYPCEFCAKDLVGELKQDPVVATSQQDFSQWLCRLHNRINVKVGKPEFDCSKVNERWRDGWRNGSCDV